MMPRRKYRTFVLCAVVVLFLLYRVAQNSREEQPPFENAQTPPFPLDSEVEPEAHVERPQELPEGQEPPSVAVEGFAKVEVPDLKEQDEPAPVDLLAIEKEESEKAPKSQEEPVAAEDPESSPSQSETTASEETPAEKVHWVKQPEKFPLRDGKMAKLPSGAPKAIPKIQFDFPAESAEAKVTREKRLQNITSEIERSWAGYRQHAWMHDELSPVSGDHRDPFCGWAATLVDSLDTLWIAGLRDQFDEAAKAVGDIDFTWSPRQDIPVFETTIRYLGGLLAAYDVSGGAAGQYKVLLEKATELAEILMGVFDTPNRMPDLYYRWAPEFASQPHRAGTVGIAELGTLSMEFTRLAQLTGEHKYYDAINRITDALIEMQESRHTSIPGLFPQGIDASGCRRMARPNPDSLSDAAQAQLAASDAVGEPLGFDEEGDIITPAGHAPIDDDSGFPPEQDPRLQKRGAEMQRRDTDDILVVDDVQPRKRPPYSAKGEGVDWDCQEQGLVPDGYGNYYYSMGGSQDSAYEYFPKEYLLLGGLEPKYKKLHEDTVEAVDKWLMYRPMLKDDEGWDILFPAKVMSWDKPQDRIFEYEITHLTCFIGGMYGLGAKIFGRDKDLETAKKLTDGCVWAYQMTPTGLMPEAAEILACPTLEKCEFNQTLWEEKLDPSADWRDEAAARWDADQEKLKLAEMQAASANEGMGVPPSEKAPEELKEAEAKLLLEKASEAEAAAAADKEQQIEEKPAAGGVVKRAAIPASGEEDGESQLPDSLKEKLNIKSAAEEPAAEAPVPHAEHVDEPDAGAPVANGIPELKVPQKALDEELEEKTEKPRPLSHKEYVKDRIESENIMPGMVRVMARPYILRPEAIESVWYMYRITGDRTWQDKGWTMWEAVMRNTRTDLANSAIDNVMDTEPSLKDEMESFWLAETLKYYYLLFAEPDVISLDDWVLNTEAHPFKRPT